MSVELKIQRLPEDDGVQGDWYLFQDLASVIWADDSRRLTNNQLQALLIKKLEKVGCNHVGGNDYTLHIPNVGLISFDSESGSFECHSSEYFPVEYVKQFIERWFDDLGLAR